MKWLGVFLLFANAVFALPSREIFFKNPEKAHVHVSPDGNYLSYLASVDGVMNIWVRTIGKEDDHPVTFVKQRPISEYYWAYDSKHLLFLNDYGGDENDHLFALNLETLEVKNLTPIENAKVKILRLSEECPENVLILMNDRDSSIFDVHRVNIETGGRHLKFKNDGSYVDFLANNRLQIRAVVRQTDRGRELCFRRKGRLRLVESYDFDDATSFSFVGFSSDGTELYYCDAKEQDHVALKRYTKSRNFKEVIFSDEEADVEGVILNPTTRKPIIVFTYGEKQKPHIIDLDFQEDWDKIASLGRGACFQRLTPNYSHCLWVMSVVSDCFTARWYLYNSETKETEFLFSSNQKLEELPLSKTETHRILARDGLELISYLTRPLGASGPTPMVLLVHGGPWVRDKFEYEPQRQWLASRGYAVLCVNYRGSGGLGKAHLNAGNRQWSKKMHDDLVDAVHWAIDNQIADPDRVAIMGGSYGGYATLVGLTFTPDLFAAGVDIVGPSHVGTLIRSIPPYWKNILHELENRIGPVEDVQLMNEISPLTYASRVSRPLLILQGQNDPRVKCQESQQMVSALEENGIPVTYVVFPDEGHGFRMEKNRLACMALIENFLSLHLKGEAEGIGNVLSESSAQIPVGQCNYSIDLN